MNRWSGLFKLLAALAIAATLAACGGKDATDNTLGWSPEKLYAEGKDEMRSGRYDAAIKLFEKLESRYPFGRWAQQAQIETAYAHYRQSERVQALAATDRFLKLYPNHPALDYVYYLRGLINFNDQLGWLAKLGGQDLAERDLDAAREAFDAFREVVTRYPDSKYAADSEARMKYLVNSMASGEVQIARYYYLRNAYIAAVNRAQNVIRKYPQAPATEEALYLMMMSYEKLGLQDLRSDTERVFSKNFPDSTLPKTGIGQSDRRWWQVWR